MKDLINMPTEEFPLNLKKYKRLMREIQDSARGFADLNDLGWPGGNLIESRLLDIHQALWQVWDLIQETERLLVAREAAAKLKAR